MNHDSSAAAKWRKQTGTVIPKSSKVPVYEVWGHRNALMWPFDFDYMLRQFGSKNRAIAYVVASKLMNDRTANYYIKCKGPRNHEERIEI